ncbi:hypothetical protein B0A52_02826 [Exophiala mesophila]|uniref:FAD-binding domain-containing protein n=1 Tax=Exophiala mesophila TaxID=212818 RepID=A0A438NE13_EXOME|nr:hypothetical protein B0A52_02826 [Exophiala mesophila]
MLTIPLNEVQEHYSVVISGAGPVGLLIALRLGQINIPTLVVERHNELLFSTRGCAYQPVVIKALEDLGLLDCIKQQAHVNRDGLHWRDIHGKELAHLPVPEGEYILLMGQKRLNDTILKELEKYPCVNVRFNTAYVGCEQDKHQVKVMLHETSVQRDDDSFVTADWLVGADGAASTVRRSLCIPFEGISFTDFRVIGTDVYYDFASEGYPIMNYIRDKDYWCGLLYTGEKKDGKHDGAPLWRVAYVESLEHSLEKAAILERAQKQLRHYVKGPEGPFDIHRAEPYRVHQRCAAEAIKGRVILAGDALHSNNPAGGFGLTTGILDAYNVGNVLSRVCRGEADESLLTEVANDRRDAWLNYTNKLSMGMYKRLASEEPQDARERDEYFASLNNDPSYFSKVRAMVEGIAGKTFSA